MKGFMSLALLSSLLFAGDDLCFAPDNLDQNETISACMKTGGEAFVGTGELPVEHTLDSESAFGHFYRACTLGSGEGCYFAAEAIESLSPDTIASMTGDDPMPTRYTLLNQSCERHVRLGCVEAARGYFELSLRRFSNEGGISESESQFFYNAGEVFLKKGCDTNETLTGEERMGCALVTGTGRAIKRVLGEWK